METQAKRTWAYEYPRPALTVDVALVSWEAIPRLLLIQRKRAPFENKWAFPGGFVDENEKLVDAARRELLEETGVHIDHLQQLFTAGDPGRDPRGWTVSVIFLGRIDPAKAEAVAADDAADAKWFPLDDLPPLAFDHAMIVERVKAQLLDPSA